jgi:GMP synthase (glutamine-hydrolysing)
MRVLVTEHSKAAGVAALGVFLQERGAELDVRRLDLGESFDSRGYDLWVSMGGLMNVGEDDENPWMAQEIRELGEWARAGKPVIGICLGAQLLAAGLGAEVHKCSRPEEGWTKIWLNDLGANDSIFQGVLPGIPVVEKHGYMFEVPKGAELLAGSQDCPNQVFAYDRAYGFQPHLEVTREMLATWPLPPEQKAEFEKGFDLSGLEMMTAAGRIFDNFWNLAQNGRA